VDAREEVVADETIADDDRVLVVAALPAHERDEHVAAEGELALLGRRAVGDRLPLADAVPDVDDRTLVDARPLVAADELLELVLVEIARVRLDPDPLGGDAGDDARPERDEDLPQLLAQLRDEMYAAAEALDFERAAVVRDHIKKLESKKLGPVGAARD
jgi:hypothetical protein